MGRMEGEMGRMEGEMPDNTAVTPPVETTTPPTAPANGNTVTVEALLAQIAELQRHRKELNDENAARRRKLDAYEKAEEERKQAAMSELEKERDKAQNAEKARDEALRVANDRVIRASVIAEAAKHGVTHPEDAYALLDLNGISVKDDGNVEGVAEAVRAIVEAGRLPTSGRPGAPSLDGGAGGTQQPQHTIALSDTQKYYAKVSGMTEQQYIEYLQKASEAEANRSLGTLRDMGAMPK
jgi:hypothetical protein